MGQLSTQDEMHANRALGKEIITQRLDVKPTEENIGALAMFLFFN